MKELSLVRTVWLFTAFWIITAVAAPSQTFQTLTTFNGTDGVVPAGVIEGTDGNLYGTTSDGGGGQYAGGGTVFRLTTGGSLSTLYSFCSLPSCADGLNPFAGLIQGSNGSLYGTTHQGGSTSNCPYGGAGCGTVFEVTLGGALTTIYSFCSLKNCGDGELPWSNLLEGTDGNLYGTTSAGGVITCADNDGYGCGTVFRLTPDKVLTTLYSFCSLANCIDGAMPVAGLVQGSDGNLYGTTVEGGSGAGGTVFTITTDGTLTTLYTFCSLPSCTDGAFPSAGLVQGSDGNFYGTTAQGGSHHDTFCPQGCGTVFRITPQGLLTKIYDFCILGSCADGALPEEALVQSSDGSLYGTTSAGGKPALSNHKACPYGCGTFFSLTPAGTLKTLWSFCSYNNCSDGGDPFSGSVTQASNGVFYGTTHSGGTSLDGTIFAWSANVALIPTFTPSSLSFGNQAVNTGITKSIWIKNVNTGSAILDFTSFTVTGSADFSISTDACGKTLLAGKSCKIAINFTPTALATESAALSVADNAPGGRQAVTLSGSGVAQAALIPTSWKFATRKVGTTSAAKSLTLRNNLSTTLTDISYSTAAPFAVSTSTCGVTLGSGKSCTISVTFSPTKIGAATGTLSVSDSANNSPQTASLSGTGD